jgi:hypothetical protein
MQLLQLLWQATDSLLLPGRLLRQYVPSAACLLRAYWLLVTRHCHKELAAQLPMLHRPPEGD